MSIGSVPAEQRVVLDDVDWSTYLALVNNSDGRHQRIAYDQGVMEIMSPSKVHETAARIIGRILECVTEELDIEICSVKSTTFKRDDQKQGFEADESYYIANASVIRDLDEIDLTIHPPPDLIIEVDISRSSMNKFTLFGGIGVPEVWRYDGENIHVYVRRDEIAYDEVEESSVLPQIPLNEIPTLIEQVRSLGETDTIRAFRKSIQERLESDDL